MVLSVAKDYFSPLKALVAIVGTPSDTAQKQFSSSSPKARRQHKEFEADIHRVVARPVKGNSELVRRLGLPDALLPTALYHGHHLSGTAASVGFGNLEVVARALMREHQNEKPYLYGVNRGGVILANLLGERLGLHHKHFVRCDYRADWNKVVCEHRPEVSFAIVVDDAVRTGRTLRAVRSYFRETHPDAKLYVLALVVSIDHNAGDHAINSRLFDLADYYPWISFERHTELPWSHGKSDEPADYIEEDGINQVVARLLAQPLTSDRTAHDPIRHGDA